MFTYNGVTHGVDQAELDAEVVARAAADLLKQDAATAATDVELAAHDANASAHPALDARLDSLEGSDAAQTAAIAGKLAKASNLSDVADAAAARVNLGLGTAAQQNTGAFDAAGAAAAAQAAAIAASDPAGAATAAAAASVPTTALDTDGTLAANSDARLATQKAVKTYVDGHVAPAGQSIAFAVALGG